MKIQITNPIQSSLLLWTLFWGEELVHIDRHQISGEKLERAVVVMP